MDRRFVFQLRMDYAFTAFIYVGWGTMSVMNRGVRDKSRTYEKRRSHGSAFRFYKSNILCVHRIHIVQHVHYLFNGFG